MKTIVNEETQMQIGKYTVYQLPNAQNLWIVRDDLGRIIKGCATFEAARAYCIPRNYQSGESK